MATTRLPAYVQVRKLADGRPAYYWTRPSWATPPAVRHGKTCPIVSTALGMDLAEAITRANGLNEAFAEWRRGSENRLAPGTVRWMFDWYRKTDKWRKGAATTRKGYRTAMDAVEQIAMKVGTFGTRQAHAIDAAAADKLYDRARKKHGERQGSYMMQVCRLVWNQAKRRPKETGVKENPFAAMGIRSKSAKGNIAATRAEYDAYREAARDLGKQSMAVAAALCFEGCQRVSDAFGFVDPDRPTRGIRWGGYVAGDRLSLIQSKTGNDVAIPLAVMVDGEMVELYPELEAELARLERRADVDLIVRDERTGEPYTIDYMQKLHRRIRLKAGLRAGLSFTTFRHGGITEIGDAGETDVRAVSGHSTLDVTRLYNKANAEKALRIAARRREHIALLAGSEGKNEP